MSECPAPPPLSDDSSDLAPLAAALMDLGWTEWAARLVGARLQVRRPPGRPALGDEERERRKRIREEVTGYAREHGFSVEDAAHQLAPDYPGYQPGQIYEFCRNPRESRSAKTLRVLAEPPSLSPHARSALDDDDDQKPEPENENVKAE